MSNLLTKSHLYINYEEKILVEEVERMKDKGTRQITIWMKETLTSVTTMDTHTHWSPLARFSSYTPPQYVEGKDFEGMCQ